MRKLIVTTLVALALTGCISQASRFKYIEGTSLTVGLYIPVNGTMYGVQAFNYLNGRAIISDTNVVFESSHSISNNSFGVQTYQNSNTKTK